MVTITVNDKYDEKKEKSKIFPLPSHLVVLLIFVNLDRYGKRSRDKIQNDTNATMELVLPCTLISLIRIRALIAIPSGREEHL